MYVGAVVSTFAHMYLSTVSGQPMYVLPKGSGFLSLAQKNPLDWRV
jgi:hypothetical protein